MTSADAQLHDQTPSRPSRLGKASIILGVIAILLIVIFLCVVSFFTATSDEVRGSQRESAFLVLGGIAFGGFFWGTPCLGFLGSFLAMAALWRKDRHRGVSVAGLVLNLIALLIFAIVLALFAALMSGLTAG